MMARMARRIDMSLSSGFAGAIRRELAAGDTDFALRMVIRGVTEFRTIVATGDVEAIERFLTPPPTTGSIRWDTLFAAVIGRECRIADVHRPPWTWPPPLVSWWFVDPTPMLMARNMQRTVSDLSCVGIWLDHSAFSTA